MTLSKFGTRFGFGFVIATFPSSHLYNISTTLSINQSPNMILSLPYRRRTSSITKQLITVFRLEKKSGKTISSNFLRNQLLLRHIAPEFFVLTVEQQNLSVHQKPISVDPNTLTQSQNSQSTLENRLLKEIQTKIDREKRNKPFMSDMSLSSSLASSMSSST